MKSVQESKLMHFAFLSVATMALLHSLISSQLAAFSLHEDTLVVTLIILILPTAAFVGGLFLVLGTVKNMETEINHKMKELETETNLSYDPVSETMREIVFIYRSAAGLTASVAAVTYMLVAGLRYGTLPTLALAAPAAVFAILGWVFYKHFRTKAGQVRYFRILSLECLLIALVVMADRLWQTLLLNNHAG